MSRATTSKGAATRGRIVDVAADLFHEQGVEATGLDQVLAASGTGKSQLYHYFDGKAALVDDVIDVQAGRIRAWHENLLADVVTVEGLRRWANAVVDAVAGRHGAYGCPLGSLAVELADRSDTHRTRVAAGFARWEQTLGAAVRRVLPDDAAAADAAAVLLTALQGGLLLAEATQEPRHLRAGLDAAIDRIARDAEDATAGRPQRGASRS